MPDVRRLAARVGALLLGLGAASLAAAQPVLITSPTTVGPLDTEITGSDGTIVPLATAEITVRGATLTINGRHEIASLVVEPNGTTDGVVTHDAAFSFDYSGGAGSDVVNGLYLIVAGDVVVGVGGRIDVSGRGFPLDEGPGRGIWSACGIPGMRSGSGGGHGGRGGNSGCRSGGDAYGDALRPTTFGSGGGSTGTTASGGSGGGVVRLEVDGALLVDGAIVGRGSNGASPVNNGAGGGAGGSICIEAVSFGGAGSLDVSGGDGWPERFAPGGGGAGGRVFIAASARTFAGTISSNGGQPDGNARGAGGTVVVRSQEPSEFSLRISNQGNSVTTTPIPEGVAVRIEQIVLDGHARAEMLSPRLEVVEMSLLDNSVLFVPFEVLSTIVVTDRLTVAPGASIDGNARGFKNDQGPGAGRWARCGTPGMHAGSGGAHGGTGGQNSCGLVGGTAYGDALRPTQLGSGGGSAFGVGGSGGGALELQVGGLLELHGTIAMNGGPGRTQVNTSPGGGAGGSLLLTVGTLRGSGSVTCDGGAGAWDSPWTRGGGGGGGRIAIYTCNAISGSVSYSVQGGEGSQAGATGTIHFGNVIASATAQVSGICAGGSVAVEATVGGGEALGYQWLLNGIPLSDGVTPEGAIITGAETSLLEISNVQPAQAGLYTVAVTTDCGTVRSNAVPLDVYCDCDPLEILAGLADGFALPRELTAPSQSLVDVLLTRRPGRPFHQFDQVPGVTGGIEEDSRLAHTFAGLPQDIVAGTLTMRLRAGSDGSRTPVAEGTDSVRLGFAAGVGAAAEENRAWERRLGGTDLDPNAGLLAGQVWTSGDEVLLTLDLAALPIDRPLGDPDGQTLSLIDALNANGFLDVTVVDETAVDFIELVLETSDGAVTPWAVGPQDASACEGERAEFSALTDGVGGPFTYQWRRDGVAIDPGENPTATQATLVLDPVTLGDYASYDVLVSGDNTCGEVTTSSAMLNDLGCCPADFDADGVLTVFDFLAFQNAFDAMDPAADLDGDGAFTLFDFLAFQTAFDAGCP